MTYDNYFKRALEDAEVQKNQELYSLFSKVFESYQADPDPSLVAGLAHKVSFYLMTHGYEAPKSVLDFMTLGQKEVAKERGKGSFWLMLAQTLANWK